MTGRLQLKFWGVRGSSPTPSAAALGYGGNTTCMEIQSRSDERIIIDAGTGAINLGRKLVHDAAAKPFDTHLFLTHFHWDHIQGIPFFAPLLTPEHKVTFYAGPPARDTRKRLERLMSSPYFTLNFNSVAATRECRQVESGVAVRRGDICITPFPLNHPQGASGYRVESDGAVIVIATDVEHGDPELDKVLLDHCEGADLLVYDAQYTPVEYTSRKGWGHSTYADAARFAKEAHVKKLVLFHHDPTHDDATVDGIVEHAARLFENVIAAREQCALAL